MKYLYTLATLVATSVYAGDVRFTAPSNQQELDAHIAELRQQYAPYLHSLPAPLPRRVRTALPVERKFTYEAKKSPKFEGIPLALAWHGLRRFEMGDNDGAGVALPDARRRRYGAQSGQGRAMEELPPCRRPF